ncbi:hypothetical protein Q73A0000_02040 [Kaistella flava (ex Peng et al. 2021)]|uniref:MORN repeat protein n=1 Tax=Kaistella flava (ex Peng et al. 2021) TaxID=2038776 RepID=A0A7M2Y4X4_9FLAO|nr:hypothetical protein [Kaistella flava (ex Peng et al. 2021)]QOW09221.1 hypothetical protein Q73A0000_02040 [Kaistella flava (ex Peng et al. 2021)]
MKNTLTVFLGLFCCLVFAQKKLASTTDLSPIINYYQDGNILLGYKGKEGKRLKIVFTNVLQSPKDPAIYEVKGKTLFDGKVTDFSGTLTLISFHNEQDEHLYKNEKGQTYHLKTGTFNCKLKEIGKNANGDYKGNLNFYCGMNPKGQLVEDDQSNVGDGFKNFLFKGTFTNNKTGEKKPVEWGDSFLHAPVGLMGDDGMFYVKVKDPQNKLGWENYRKAYQLEKQDSEALKEEQRIWWK